MKLYKKVELQEKIIITYREGLSNLEHYLPLSKFYCLDNNVNTSDIFLRLNELNSQIGDIEFNRGECYED